MLRQVLQLASLALPCRPPGMARDLAAKIWTLPDLVRPGQAVTDLHAGGRGSSRNLCLICTWVITMMHSLFDDTRRST